MKSSSRMLFAIIGIGHLVGAYANSSSDLGPAAEAQLEARGIDTSAVSLKALARDKNIDADLRKLAIASLGEAKDPKQHVEVIQELLSDNSRDIRVAALIALRSIRSETAQNRVINVLRKDSDLVVRRVAITALAEIAPRAALAEFISLASDTDNVEVIRTDSINAVEGMLNLKRIDIADVIQDLRPLLDDDNKRVRLAAALPLSSAGDPTAIPILVEIATQYLVSTEAYWESSKAVRSIERHANVDFGYFNIGDRRTTHSEKAEAIQRLRGWWEERKADYVTRAGSLAQTDIERPSK